MENESASLISQATLGQVLLESVNFNAVRRSAGISKGTMHIQANLDVQLKSGEKVFDKFRVLLTTTAKASAEIDAKTVPMFELETKFLATFSLREKASLAEFNEAIDAVGNMARDRIYPIARIEIDELIVLAGYKGIELPWSVDASSSGES